MRLKPLDCTKHEYKTVASQFLQSMSGSTIIRIEEIINHKLRYKCVNELNLLKAKHVLKPDMGYVRDLFHGTNKTPPETIYSSEAGFMIQYSSPDGRYGSGIYFAKKASYSDNYAYKTVDAKSGAPVKQIMLVKVITANVYDAPNALRDIRTAPWVDENTEMYDSVKGKSNGEDIYMVYENSRACPAYLITYQ